MAGGVVPLNEWGVDPGADPRRNEVDRKAARRGILPPHAPHCCPTGNDAEASSLGDVGRPLREDKNRRKKEEEPSSILANDDVFRFLVTSLLFAMNSIKPDGGIYYGHSTKYPSNK